MQIQEFKISKGRQTTGKQKSMRMSIKFYLPEYQRHRRQRKGTQEDK